MSLDVARDVPLPVGGPSAVPERLADNGAGSDAASVPARRLPCPAMVPTQAGPMGLRFDFNDGCRVLLPETGRPWRIRLSDLDTGNVLYEIELQVRPYQQHQALLRALPARGLAATNECLCHDYCAADRDVLMQFPVGTLGDPHGLVSLRGQVSGVHGCRLTCAMAQS